MGYRVDYVPLDRAMRQNGHRVGGWPVLCAVFFLCFLVIVCSFWSDGREALGRFIFPGDWAVVEKALDLFREEAQSGAPPAACLEAFCREIIAGADIDLR